MKKSNQKGFTLIELLAVITIMGILMLVAIPAIQRTIANSRRDTFKDTASSYVNAVRTMWAADELKCRTGANTTAPSTLSSSVAAGKSYYVLINSAKTGENFGTETSNTFKPYPMVLEQGGKSSWGSADVTGIIKITVDSNNKPKFEIALTDGTHGIKSFKNIDSISRSDIALSGATKIITNPESSSALSLASGFDSTAISQYLCKDAA